MINNKWHRPDSINDELDNLYASTLLILVQNITKDAARYPKENTRKNSGAAQSAISY